MLRANSALAVLIALTLSLVLPTFTSSSAGPTYTTAQLIFTAAGAPKTVMGIVIAVLVLLPETWAAVRAAHATVCSRV